MTDMIHLKKQVASFLLARLNPELSRALCCASIWYTCRPLSPSLSLSCEVNASIATPAKLHVNINHPAVLTKGFAIICNADEGALIAFSKYSSTRFWSYPPRPSGVSRRISLERIACHLLLNGLVLRRKPLLVDVHFPRLSTSRTPLRVCFLGFQVILRSLGQPPGC